MTLVTSFIDGVAVSPTRTDPHAESFRDVVGKGLVGNYGWYAQQVVAPDRMAGGGLPARFPGGSVQISVRPGDTPVSSGERNEVLGMFNASRQDEGAASGTHYYGISLYLPSAWRDSDPFFGFTWAIACQCKASELEVAGGLSPAFALDLSAVPGRYTLSQRGGDTAGFTSRVTDLGAHVFDRWVDFAFRVTWAADNTGDTAAWTRIDPARPLRQVMVGTETPIAPWNTPTLYSVGGVAVNHYWKRGLYRSPSNFTQTLHAGPLARAANLADAAWAAFGQWP